MTATWILLPRFWRELNLDRGRLHAVDAQKSVGKPLSGGVIFVSIFAIMVVLYLPFGSTALYVLPSILAAMLLGYYDDKVGGLHEYTLAAADFLISIVTVLIIFGTGRAVIWLPILSHGLVIPW